MDMQDHFDREEAQIERDYMEGLIDLYEYRKHLRDLQRDYRDEAREAAQHAYDREMERW